MKTYNRIKSGLVAFGMLALLNACTDLDEKMYSKIGVNNFYSNKTEVYAAVIRPYTHARAWAAPTGQDSHWRVSEYSSDQIARTQKGRHGYDGAKWIRLDYHTWTIREGSSENAWRLMY